MLLHVQRELRLGETEWLRAEPAVSLVLARARGGGAEYGSSPGTRARVRTPSVGGSSSGLQQGQSERPGRRASAQAPLLP